jgi:glycerol kinase
LRYGDLAAGGFLGRQLHRSAAVADQHAAAVGQVAVVEDVGSDCLVETSAPS